ncbi:MULTISPECIES: heat-inducible transcriptional repressor HrcA [Methylomonas]|uniref:Heat-inducible transcription repressor HrcA n=1 Tax=Methylomonas koyamae TaxID=702114 RepID=A0A177PCU7_9GAMM|nr:MULTISPECIES: heat-inducible transcriptional repressor HrcA [Methylomonas]NJA07132.1 heat-inducible transcriptional repressor HrcA [Methylococcaceae bacterium WWC4]OAI27872.1 heat-inducible transcriptional repressor HrcA [Methylomonas koyamae]OHX37952.1 heat-inducible transcriptional repressor HrcA [Methylomonas sp. LWB]WGS87084.1 heat-inducible transcriptional repressor HrcA [Methylomonas sp. UP202]
MASGPDLNERSAYLLKALVERYIQDGQPVGSRVLSKDPLLKLSPASIRNVMADLEEMGLIHSPHTSAGRVPTVAGYRLFVDSLLTVKPLASSDLDQLQSGLLADADKTGDVLSKASRLLSDMTHMAGVVTLPRREMVTLRHIEFLPMSSMRVLVIFVTDGEEVHNKIIHTQRQFSPAELQQAANYLNSVYAGLSLAKIREQVLREMEQDQQRVNQGMIDAVSMAQLTFAQQPNDDYVLSGETNLMGFSELSDMDRLKQLFEAFSQKRGVIHLLDQCLLADGVQIFIGEESGYSAFDHCSLVTAPYSVNDEVVGVLGVIGPTRMAYEKVIPFVDVTAKILGAALNPK